MSFRVSIIGGVSKRIEDAVTSAARSSLAIATLATNHLWSIWWRPRCVFIHLSRRSRARLLLTLRFIDSILTRIGELGCGSCDASVLIHDQCFRQNAPRM